MNDRFEPQKSHSPPTLINCTVLFECSLANYPETSSPAHKVYRKIVFLGSLASGIPTRWHLKITLSTASKLDTVNWVQQTA